MKLLTARRAALATAPKFRLIDVMSAVVQRPPRTCPWPATSGSSVALTAVNCMSKSLPLAGLRREVGADEYRVPRIEVEHPED